MTDWKLRHPSLISRYFTQFFIGFRNPQRDMSLLPFFFLLKYFDFSFVAWIFLFLLCFRLVVIQLLILEMTHYDSDENSPKYEHLMFESGQNKITYQNVPALTMRIVTLCLSSFYFGYCLTYFSTFQDGLNQEVLNLSVSQNTFRSILIGVVPVGAMIGAAVAPLIMKAFTRKQFILFMNLMAFIVEGIIQVTNVYVLLGCRIVQGFFIGNYMALVPIYINELAPKEVVGSFGVFTQLFVVIALVVSYGIGLIFQATNLDNFTFYRLMVGLNGITLLIQTILLLANYVPESPNSLIAKNKTEEAKKVIGMFTLPEYVQRVYKEKLAEVDVEMNQSDKNQPTFQYSWKAYLLGFQLPFMQQLTGINAIVTSASVIVKKIIPGLANDVPLIINSVQLVATIGAVFVLTKVGRKPLTLFGNLGLAVTDIAIGILFIFDDWDPSGMFVFALLMVYMVIYGISLGPVVWLYVPEIIPAKVVPLATMMNWFGCSLCVIFTPIAINDNHGNPYPVFLFYGAITFLFFLINSVLMVETKGKSSELIALSFTKKD